MTDRNRLNRIRAELRASAADRMPSTALGCFSVRTRIVELERYLERNLHQRLSLADAAYVLGLERTYCSRVFRDCTGMPYSQWDREIRIRIAKMHLIDTDARIAAIGLAVGYEDLTTFERNFRRSAGASPKQFRKTHPPPPQGKAGNDGKNRRIDPNKRRNLSTDERQNADDHPLPHDQSFQDDKAAR